MVRCFFKMPSQGKRTKQQADEELFLKETAHTKRCHPINAAEEEE